MKELAVRGRKVIRPFCPSDLDTLYMIDQTCFPRGIAYSHEELSGFIEQKGSKAWVAEAEKEIVGFIVAGREGRKIGHVITIDVMGRWRRRGIGSALMDTAEEWARGAGIEFFYLETAEENLLAQRFYEARGYQKVEQLPNYYGKGLSAWLMMKRLR